ncbi:hypothetical protein KQX54_010892 [Cotesia glomerata]|uniref:Uncharacterized protein n=1 Tax=Cotesia glomerata TaxID=32391 RepID=A0AAV7J5A5_COTGL|nr:hypothetical protein KQX54_010892 [Cotesia glomerata]
MKMRYQSYEDFNLTGAAFTTSVEGKFLDSNGNINNFWSEFNQHSQCSERTIDLVHVGPKLMPPTAFNGTITELSQSCKHHVLFGDTSWSEDYMTQIVPFVDLQEVATNPPQPINGIG